MRQEDIDMIRMNLELLRRAEAAEARVEALKAAAKLVLEADMRGVRDIDALNQLEGAAGFSQQGGKAS
jgi:hypothetical protein